MEENTKRVDTTEYLRYHFTEEEKTKSAQEMAQTVIQARDLEEQKKATTSQFASQINEAVAKSNSAAQKLESGFEMRTIPCQDVYDYVAGTLHTYRMDTHEIVKERVLTPQEMQRKLFKDEENKEDS